MANTKQSPSDEVLYTRRWSVCCDFHDDPNDIMRHLAKLYLQYGITEDGKVIVAPKGWKILPFREIVPHIHREYDKVAGWCQPRNGRSTMTPIFATISGYVRAYAVPDVHDEPIRTLEMDEITQRLAKCRLFEFENVCKTIAEATNKSK